MAELTWYFDYVSPFAYLQWRRMGDLPDGVRVTHRPVLLAGLLSHWGTRGPAETPAKREFTYRHVQWLAERDGVEFRMPPAHPFNPLPALRLTLALGARPEIIDRVFAYVWREGRSVDDVGAFTAMARELGCDDPAGAIGAPEVKDALRAGTEAAVGQGVFGVPTFVAGERLFWGVDATPMLLDHLHDPARFEGGEYARIATLPAAATRKT